MNKKTKLYEGKTKILFPGAKETEVILKFKDDAAVNGDKKGDIKGKGAVNNKMSCHLFQYLEGYNVPTHYVEQVSDTEMKCKKVAVIRIAVSIHNIAAGNLSKRYGLEEGTELKTPILEFYLKNDKLHNPLINEYHAYALELATNEEVAIISKQAIKINAVLRSYFQRRDISLVDFSLEFGRFEDKILLADELSLDTFRFWDAKTGKKIDTDRFGKNLRGAEEAYKGILERVLWEGIQTGRTIS